ncbi:MAG TPA: energy-coupling factor transporter ATPase [Firmicutes bacterium]|nr:energy-coupling factor transporter ATPase [Bacillota bacterium]
MSIELKDVSFYYFPGTPMEVKALDGVSLSIEDGESVGIMGPTGSGKSTLVQLMNGLLKPSAGEVLVDGINLSSKGTNLKSLRQRVGLVFQYPEHQLFEETVLADVCFGPRNMGFPPDKAEIMAREALRAVGVDEKLFHRSPFELSGGQMRRVAIAGVLAMSPNTLILDEPTAGLDPRGRNGILGRIVRLHEERKITVILVSHNMEDIARVAKRVIVLSKGKVVMDGSTRSVFSEVEALHEVGLGVPQVTELMYRLGLPCDVITVEEARTAIRDWLRRKGTCSRES